jgi:putative oxidoreductase
MQDPLHWMDGAASAPAGVLQLWAAAAEFVGGIALALGLLTPVACFAIATTMGYAVMHHVTKGHAWIALGKGSYEAALGYLVTSVALGLAGPGHVSADAWLFGRPRS